MKMVERADIRPHHCAAIPHLGNAQREGYIDTGTDIRAIDPHVYVSVVAVRQMCVVLGWPTAEQHTEAVAEVARLTAELEQVRAERDELERELSAVEVLKSRRFEQAKRPGRPRKSETEQEVA